MLENLILRIIEKEEISVSDFITGRKGPGPEATYTAACNLIHEELKKMNSFKFDVHMSGTTAVSVLLNLHDEDNPTVTTLNVGDSRAILVEDRQGMWVPVELSHDHKPDDQEEKH